MFNPSEAWGSDIAARLEKTESDRVAGEEKRKAAIERRATLSLSEYPDIYTAFNAVYTPHDWMTTAGYDQDGDRFRHPNSESGSFSANVREDEHGVLRVNTLSPNDLLYVEGSKSGHDSISVFCTLIHGGDMSAALKDAGDNLLAIGGVPYNKAKQIEFAKKQAAKSKSLVQTVFLLTQIKKLIDNPINIQWLIKYFIEAGGMNVISAPYGTYKTFLALDMALCVAADIPWCGNKVTQAPVIYICGEGLAGIADRVAALCVKYGIPCPECLFISQVPAQLTDPENAKLVGEAVNELCLGAALVIVDTLNRNFGGADENSTKDMTLFVNNLDRIFRATGKTVIVVHHTGHVEQGRGRGSIVLPSSAEGEFILKKKFGGVMLECIKQKNAAKPQSMQFSLKPITLHDRVDEDEQPVRSLVLEYKGVTLPEITHLKAVDKEVLDCLHDAIEAHGIEPPASIKIEVDLSEEHSLPNVYKVVLVSHWRGVVFETSESKTQDAKRKAFERSRDALLNGSYIEISGEYVWSKI